MEARLIMRVARAATLLLAAVVGTAGAPLSAHAASPPPQTEALIAAAKADMLVDPRRAIARANAARLASDRDPPSAGRDITRATADWLRGEAYTRLDQPRSALPLLRQSEEIARRVDPESQLHADTLLSLGSVLIDVGRITEALTALQQAHHAFQRLGQARSRAKALIMIALLYNGARDFSSALRYFGQATEAYRTDDGLTVAIEGGRGTAFVELGRYAQAEQAFAHAVALARSMESVAVEAVALTNLANAQLLQGHVADAARTIAQGQRLTSDPAASSTRPVFVMLAAKAALQRGELPRAAAFIDERFRGVDTAQTTLNDREAHAVAYDIYTRAGRAADALAHLAALKRLDDQATEIARSNNAALAAAKFDYQNQELRIAKLKADDLQKTVTFERKSAQTQRTIFIAAALATLLVIVLLAVGLLTLRRSRNQTRAANTELESSNAALNKALAAKTEFLATTSHEIRTPLNGILGMTQVMAADPALNAEMRDRVAVVHGAGVTMRALVDDILDVAKIESGKMTIEEAPLDLATTVRDATQLWRDQAVNKGLTFSVEVGGPAWIMGDAGRLRQIVFNLLSNAVKFTATGHVRITSAVQDGRATIVVEDTGIGIDPWAHEMIFEMFRQADATTTRQFGGTGLGLSICRNLARAMGGDVMVDSRLGAGATFTLDLPVRAAERAVLAQNLDVVVVERNPIARATLRALLDPHGTIGFVDTLLEAEALVRSSDAETLLVDHASIAGDTNAVAALAARSRVRTILLFGADTPEIAPPPGVVTIRRPIGKKSLVDYVFYVNKALVRDAA